MIETRTKDFSNDETVERTKSAKPGATADYLGTVRELPERTGLKFEDDKNAIQRLEEIGKKAIDRFDVEDVAIVHRVGFLRIWETILLIGVSASRWESAVGACKSIVDGIKDFHESWKEEVQK